MYYCVFCLVYNFLIVLLLLFLPINIYVYFCSSAMLRSVVPLESLK